ncbi:MAG: hypothetical protein H6864_03030 [Micavibrio sp.]|nr:hypothetical protein [Micavibrio sp.]
MPLTFDPKTSEIWYEGKRVGECVVNKGVARVTLNIAYECATDEWVVPLSWFGCGLSKLESHQQKQKNVVLKIITDEEDVEENFCVLRLLTEKDISQNGYVWRFHKNDPDHWPSLLHGHEYDKNLKLDALTGKIYDVATKQCCSRLSKKKLSFIQSKLRSSPDFLDLVTNLLDGK